MANQYKNKVIYFGDTLIDLSEDTVTSDVLLQGYTAHSRSGAPITGSMVFPNEIFWAEKDVTTFSEIDDAIDEGKSVMMRNGRFTYTCIYSTNSSKVFSRAARGDDHLYIDCWYVDTSDVWTQSSTSAPRKPDTSTDNAIARYDGTSGALQNSSVIVEDSGNVSFPATTYWGSGSYLINSLGNAKLNLVGLGGADVISSRALNVSGATSFNGAVYFRSNELDDATTFRVDANADARFRNIYAYRGRIYSYNEATSPSIFTSYVIGGSVNDGRDASGTGLVDTLPPTASFGAMIIRQPAKRETYTNNVLQSTEYLKTQLWFRMYGVATSGTDVGKYISYREDYTLPEIDNDRTTNVVYRILTTKSAVTVAQGGTGATSFTANSVVMSGSSTTAALTTRAVTNNTTSTALAANTNIPTMNTVKYGLDNRLNRTTAVNAADTGYTTYMARGIALNSSATNPTVNGAISFTYA